MHREPSLPLQEIAEGTLAQMRTSNINVVGDGTTIDIVGDPGTNTLTASLVGGGIPSQTYDTNVAGPVKPTAAGLVNVNASTSTYTDGTVANTLKIELQGTDHALFVGRGVHSSATTVAVGSNGQVLVGATGGDPAFATLTSSASTLTYTTGANSLNIDVTAPLPVAYGGTGDTSLAAYAVVCGGTTNTGALQSVSGVGTLGQVLTSGGAATLPTWQTPSSELGSVNVQVFTSSNTYTPTSGMLYCVIEVLGGGGAGGGAAGTGVNQHSAGGGGGAGEYAKGLFNAAAIGASQSVTVGAGGTGVSGTTGNNGSTTSVGVLITAAGGIGGETSAVAATSALGFSGNGGTGGSGGSVRTAGGAGSFGLYLSVTAGGIAFNYGGQGANSQYGAGGEQVAAAPSAGAAALGYGAGGGGGVANSAEAAQTGGNGSSGIVIITEYI